MGRASRPQGLPQELQELQEEGLPEGWGQYWHGQRRRLTAYSYNWYWHKAEMSMQGAEFLRAVPGPQGISLSALSSAKVLFPLDGVSAPLPPGVSLHRDDLLYETGEGYISLSNSDGEYNVVHWQQDSSGGAYVNLMRRGIDLNGKPLLLLPGNIDESAFLYYQGEEGLLYREFEEDFFIDTGEYRLAEGSDWQVLDTLPTLHRSGALFYSSDAGAVLYSDPEHKTKTLPCPFPPLGGISIGDPHNPKIVIYSLGEIALLPYGDVINTDGPIEDISADSQGDSMLLVWIERRGQERLLCSPHQQDFPLPEGTRTCRALPNGGVLLGGSSGLYFYSADDTDIHQLSSDPVDEIELAVRDESEAEVLVRSGNSVRVFRGEIIREK